MKKNLIAVLVVAAAVVAVESLAAPADDAIRQVFVEMDRCLANSDAKCLGAVFVEDATFGSPMTGPKLIKGKAEMVKFIEGSLAGVKSVKQKRTVENVRMIGEDRALVDVSVAAGAGKEDTADAAGGQYHDVVLMVVKDGKWLCQDSRSYVVGHSNPAKKESAPPEAKKEPAPPVEKEAAAPAEKEPEAPAEQ